METFGLRCWHGIVERQMVAPHVHNEVEINLVLEGCFSYLFGGSRQEIPEGKLAIFWAAVPHQLLWSGSVARVAWATIPMVTFMGWDLPRELSQAVMGGKFVLDPRTDRLAADEALFRGWDGGASSAEPLRRRILLLQLEGRLCEVALALNQSSTLGTLETPHRPSVPIDNLGQVEVMAAYVTQHYAQPLSVSQIARAVGLNPNYASLIFKQGFGCTPMAFLQRTRLAHAQRLLATTDKSVLQIAFESGFGSSARFHAAFKVAVGQSPAHYRRGLHRERY